MFGKVELLDISYLYITGRSKEIINKGGEVISPFEIEEAIITAAKNRVKVGASPVPLAIPYLPIFD